MAVAVDMIVGARKERRLRTFVMGDVSAHASVFVDLVRSIGGDPTTGRLPEDVVLVHTGDLVHKGPGSADCVKIASRLLANAPDQFFSIWGNHDASYVDGAPSVIGRRLVTLVDEETAATIRRWWEQATLPLAVAIETDDGWHLVTHAGLTCGRWKELGAPDCVTAAKALNALVGIDAPLAFRSGMLVTGSVDDAAGSCWAETTEEVLGPWLAHAAAGGVVPFGQIHGHASVVADWSDPKLYPNTPPAVAVAVRIDHDAWRYEMSCGGRTFNGVDWIMLANRPKKLPPLLELSAQSVVC